MTPQELLTREPEETSHLLKYLADYSYNHIPEAELTIDEIHVLDVEDIESQRVQVKLYKEFNFDFRRFWRLSSVWLDGKAVMICCNAGREGADHVNRFILDGALFRELVIHIRQVAATKLDVTVEVTALDKDIPEMTSFYGDELDGYFEYYW